MLTYTITEVERQDLMEALEWAMYAINRAIADEYEYVEDRGLDVGSGVSADVLEHLNAEKSTTGYLWDAINRLQPANN
jgi:hypothetical protein